VSEFWDKRLVTITGGAGMIGSHLAERLIEAGAEVQIVDSLERGCEENVPLGAKLWAHRLGDSAYSDELVAPWDVDVVFHLAAKVTGIGYNEKHNWEMMMENLAINQEVSSMVAQHTPSRYVYVSTSCVYPHDAPVPTPEGIADVCNPESTNWGYGVAKWVGEQQARVLHHQFGIPTAIIRFFNAFGPRDYYDEESSHVVPALLRRFLEREDPIVVWGSGDQTRVFVDCRDLAKAAMIVAERGCDGEATNIGHQREISIRELAYVIRGLLDSPANIIFDKGRPDGYPRRAADTTRFRGMSGGWEPDTPLVETLTDMIADYKERYPDGFAD